MRDVLNRLTWALALALLALLCASAFYGHAHADGSGDVHARFRHCVTEDDYEHVRMVTFTRIGDNVRVVYRCVTY